MAEYAAYLFLVAISGFVLWFLSRRKVQHGPVLLLPLGSCGLPFVGEFLFCYLSPHDFVEKRRKLYGNLFRTNLFGYPTVISTDPETNKFILQSDGHRFVPQYPFNFRILLGRWNIGSARGELHKTLRGAALRFINTSAIKDQFLSQTDQIMASRLRTWTYRTINVKDEAQEIIFYLMVRHLFQSEVPEEVEKMKERFYILRDGIFSLPINLPGTCYHRSMQKREELVAQIRKLVEERKKKAYSHEDILSTLLKQENQLQLTTEQIVDLLVGLIFGGFDTTTRIMVLAVKHISDNSHVITELRKEHAEIKKNKSPDDGLTWSDYKSMNFTRSVIMETLRVGDGQINNLLMRKAIQDVKLNGGYTIPKGWTCIVYDRSNNTDSKYYKDPLSFNPWRWQDEDLKNAPFTPFGGGPRLCPGRDMAFLVISCFLHHLVTQFKWTQIPSASQIRWFNTPAIQIEVESILF